MSHIVGISIFGSNADTSLSVDQHYSDRQHIFYYEPSPYSAFLASVHRGCSLPFLEWIAALLSHPKYKKLTSAGHQLCQTFQSELRRQPEVLDTRYAQWINSYPRSWHMLLSEYSSTTWKLVNSMLDSSLSSTSLETIPDLATWLAAAIWTMCTYDQSLEAGKRVDRLSMQMVYMDLRFSQLPPLHPPNTDAVENFKCKIKSSSHTCWDGHDPGWYASAVSYLNDDNDPEFVSGPEHTYRRKCKECSLVDHAHKFTKALSSSSHPSAQFSTYSLFLLSAAMVSKCCVNDPIINHLTAGAVPSTSRCRCRCRVC